MTGEVEPEKPKERSEEETATKKVDLFVSPQPKKDAAAGGGEKKPEERKADDEIPEEKNPPQEVINYML